MSEKKEDCTDEVNNCVKETEFYHKWYKRWLKVAERFKEAK